MAYNENLANRIREKFAELNKVEEKEMMGGLAFMYNNKMCVGIIKDELICRIDLEVFEEALEKRGCRPMDFTGRPMKGWIMVEEDGMKTRGDFDYWIELALNYNSRAKVSKPARKKSDK